MSKVDRLSKEQLASVMEVVLRWQAWREHGPETAVTVRGVWPQGYGTGTPSISSPAVRDSRRQYCHDRVEDALCAVAKKPGVRDDTRQMLLRIGCEGRSIVREYPRCPSLMEEWWHTVLVRIEFETRRVPWREVA